MMSKKATTKIGFAVTDGFTDEPDRLEKNLKTELDLSRLVGGRGNLTEIRVIVLLVG